jgi:hypothetical protein
MAAHSQPEPNKYFEEAEANQHLADDSEAWNGVTGLLLFIVTLGLSLAFLTLYLSSGG